MKVSLFKKENKVMAGLTGNNLKVLVEAKKILNTQILLDSNFAKKCGEAIIQEVEKPKLDRDLAKKRGLAIRNQLISKNLITPRKKRIKK